MALFEQFFQIKGRAQVERLGPAGVLAILLQLQLRQVQFVQI
jgi:hypothetical protein